MTAAIGRFSTSSSRRRIGSDSRVLLLFLLIALAVSPAAAVAASGPGSSSVASDPDKKPVYKVVDWTESRFVVGDPRKFERPAKIVIMDVMTKIPAYQQVLKEKLTEKDPRYYFLMQEATQQLVAAVEKVTRKTNHDLVADAGAVEVEGGEIPDLTQAVIDALKK